MNLSRREFLAASATALASCAGPPAPRPADRVPVVDTHLHCFAGKGDPRFPYHPRGPYQPEPPSGPELLLKLMDGAGVDFAVVVHPEPYQDDHRYLTYCLETGGKRLKGTCLFFSDRPDSAEMMPAIVKTLPIVAARIHAYAPDRLPPFGKPELRAFWKRIADLGIAVQLHFEPRHAPGFEPLIREFKETTAIIDHLGRPLQGTPEEHEVVVRWSRFPNTVMKLSAFQPDTQYPHRDIAPIIRRLADAYGADRMIYGGGFGSDATAESYRAARGKASSYISHFSAADQAKVLGGTAARLFRFA